jgi:hypothetical protein
MNRLARKAAIVAESSAAVLLVALLGMAPASAAARPEATLDNGFAEMYELNFPTARSAFDSYIQAHPKDPMGEAALAASYLFEEFNRQGVLTSAFFLNDKKLLGGVPDPGRDGDQSAFLQANDQARDMAEAMLKTDPRDPDGLLVLTLANGMQADYDALIAKQDIASLWLLRQTKQSAQLLLAVNPHADDAYLALGAANYIIGCLPGYKRFIVSFGGIHGNRALGMQQLNLASENGHYLKPFAKVLLAMAALREKKPKLARTLLAQLHEEYPQNPDFANELAKLN